MFLQKEKEFSQSYNNKQCYTRDLLIFSIIKNKSEIQAKFDEGVALWSQSTAKESPIF